MKKVASKDKLVELEWIRTICCLLVIIIHVTSEYWFSFIGGSLQYKSIVSLNSLAQFAVPCFIFISGFVLYYVYHNREYEVLDFYKRRMTKIMIPYLVWSSIYILSQSILSSVPIDFKSVAKNFLLGRSSSHLYFVVLIIQFYFVFPLILKIYKKIDNKFLSMGIFLGLNIATFFIEMPFKDRFFMNYLMFFGLGIILANFKVEKFKLNNILKIKVFALYFIFTVYYILERYRGIAQLPLISINIYKYAWWIFSFISIITIYISKYT